ncbi:MAG: hypothetical protein M3N18_13705 [Actinomycetota bacterium]|nr:hypothetical protein [Actinomycetota bacterium]
MTKEELEQRFAAAGWDLDGSFAEHLVIGYNGDGMSLLAHKEAWDAADALFEILDHDEMVSYWVREVPTPDKAALLLREHGRPSEEWDEGQPS